MFKEELTSFYTIYPRKNKKECFLAHVMNRIYPDYKQDKDSIGMFSF